MQTRSTEGLVKQLAKIVDPFAQWSAPPINMYSQGRQDRAIEKAREILALIGFTKLSEDHALLRLVIAARQVAVESQGRDPLMLQELDAASVEVAGRMLFAGGGQMPPKAAVA